VLGHVLLANGRGSFEGSPITGVTTTIHVRDPHHGRAGSLWEAAGMARVEVVVGDITALDVDALVTAANESLLGGGGVDGAIHRAAGPRLAEAGAAIAPCDPGDAKVTPAFDLDPPVRHVIHTVGPVWEGGGAGEDEVLASCYRSSLAAADEVGARSVAFPAIATGIYGFPAQRAAAIAAATVTSTATSVERILLVAFDDDARRLLADALAG
jgi:O-acetyl-ADP-ribose deacetylase (regulator of RNase III)